MVVVSSALSVYINDAGLAAILRTVISTHDAIAADGFRGRLEKVSAITRIGHVDSIKVIGRKVWPPACGGYAHSFIALSAAKIVVNSNALHRTPVHGSNPGGENRCLKIIMTPRW